MAVTDSNDFHRLKSSQIGKSFNLVYGFCGWGVGNIEDSLTACFSLTQM